MAEKSAHDKSVILPYSLSPCVPRQAIENTQINILFSPVPARETIEADRVLLSLFVNPRRTITDTEARKKAGKLHKSYSREGTRWTRTARRSRQTGEEKRVSVDARKVLCGTFLLQDAMKGRQAGGDVPGLVHSVQTVTRAGYT